MFWYFSFIYKINIYCLELTSLVLQNGSSTDDSRQIISLSDDYIVGEEGMSPSQSGSGHISSSNSDVSGSSPVVQHNNLLSLYYQSNSSIHIPQQPIISQTAGKIQQLKLIKTRYL